MDAPIQRGTILVKFLDLPFSRGTHSELASEARQAGIELAPQEPCRQRTMKLEIGKQERSLFNFFFFFRSEWSPVMGPRGKGQPGVRQVQEAQPVLQQPWGSEQVVSLAWLLLGSRLG